MALSCGLVLALSLSSLSISTVAPKDLPAGKTPMIDLRQLVTPECVILELAETDHEEVVLEMIGHLCKIGKVPSGDCYCFGNAVLERESHVGTGLGSGGCDSSRSREGAEGNLGGFWKVDRRRGL